MLVLLIISTDMEEQTRSQCASTGLRYSSQKFQLLFILFSVLFAQFVLPLTTDCTKKEDTGCCSGAIQLRTDANAYSAVPARAFKDCKITSVIIPNNILSIGNSAFENTSLTEVVIATS